MSSVYEGLFRHVLFPLYESVLRRRSTLAYLAEAERNQWLSADELGALRWKKLERLLAHCWEEVPYYRRRWRELGLEPGDIRDEAAFARLPVLGKEEIRANFDDLHARSWRGCLSYKTTGGSTGEPLRFGYTRESYERRIAAMWRGYSWAGARMGRRTLYLWGAPITHASARRAWKDRLYHAAFNRHMLNAFLMSADNLPEYAAAIERSRPEIIVGYVGPLVRLAEWLRAQGRKPHRPHAVLGAAEALHAPQRALLEEVFGAPVYDTYGCREFMLIASECAHREGLHTTADHLHVELANLQARHAGGESGDVIVTDLHNFGMPLLRYANGDMATPSRRTCACGRGLPLLERIDGRRLDTLRTPAGHLLPGEYIVYAFLDVLSVKRYQVVQRESDALDIRLVPGDGFGEATLEQIRRLLENVIGESMKLRFHVVDDIPASASGKYRVAICELR